MKPFLGEGRSMLNKFAMLGAVTCLSVVCGCSSSSSSAPETTDSAGTVSDTMADDTPAAEGGTCSPATCSMTGFACDPADGKCKPDGKGSAVGAACTTTGPGDPACGTAPSAICNDKINDGFPGGYCSWEPCTTAELCPIGSSCGRMGGESPACYKNCNSDADCRTPDYKCQPMDQLAISGASKSVCHLAALPCNKASDCPSGLPKCTMSVCGK